MSGSLAQTARRVVAVPAQFWRGGTSKGLILWRKHLPNDRKDWDALFLGMMGSPDPFARQLDGIGGGYSSVSKICVVEESARDDVDVEYTFVQVGVKQPVVDYSSQCGNMVAAIGPHFLRGVRRDPAALMYKDEGQRMARVRVLNTNTNKIVHVRFPLNKRHNLDDDGDFRIDGVPDTAARIICEYQEPGGSKTGAFLPTGNAVDRLESGQIEASLIDCGNPSIFVRACDLGVEGSISPDEMLSHPTLLSRLEALRQEGAVAMGMAQTAEETPLAVPKICLVAPMPSDNTTADLLVRTISSKDPHKAIPMTVALATAAASQCKGTVVQQCLEGKQPLDLLGVTIAHPSGKICVGATMRQTEHGKPDVESGVVYRTARLLFKGEVYARLH